MGSSQTETSGSWSAGEEAGVGGGLFAGGEGRWWQSAEKLANAEAAMKEAKRVGGSVG